MGSDSQSPRLRSYLEAIGISEDSVREGLSVDLLQELYVAHSTNIAFCSLQITNGEVLQLDDGLVHKRLVERKLGGVCFDQCGLFGWALRELGFNVQKVAGEVYTPTGFASLLTHHFVIVTMENQKYVLDVGFPLKPLTVLLLGLSYEQPQLNGKIIKLNLVEYQWIQNSSSDGISYETVNRFQLREFDLETELKPAVKQIYAAESAFMNGWMVSIVLKDDATIASLAHGSFAGKNIPLQDVKYVLRPPLPQPEIVEIIPLESERVDQLLADVFLMPGRRLHKD